MWFGKGCWGYIFVVFFSWEVRVDLVFSRLEFFIGRDIWVGRFYFWFFDKVWGSGCYRKVEVERWRFIMIEGYSVEGFDDGGEIF